MMHTWEPNLYKNPLKYDFNDIKIKRIDKNDVRVFDNKQHYLPEFIVSVDDSWSEDQIKKLIHTAQRSAVYAFQQGKKEKEREIRKTLGFEK